MNGVHCQMSPIITAVRASHGSVAQAKLARPERLEDRQERAPAGVGQHLEQVAHADRRDHHRQQEDDPEEAPAGQPQRGQHRQPQAQPVLHDESDADVDQGHEERAGPAAGREGGRDEQPRSGRRLPAPPTARRTRPSGPTRAPHRLDERPHEQRRGDARRSPSRSGVGGFEQADEMDLLAAEQQRLVVAQSQEADVDAVGRELEPRQRQVEGDDREGRSTAPGRPAGPARGRRSSGRGALPTPVRQT